ncbi:MAG: hypothetical protein NVSMB6_20000 [Burkholderiaceae bacterium]
MPTRRLLVIALLTAAFGTLTASPLALAFERSFPPHAKRGVMRPDLFPAIVIDGKPRILTTGARIWNADNLIQMPASLLQKSMIVNYTEDDTFHIDRVWILSAEEAAQSPKQQHIGQQK